MKNYIDKKMYFLFCCLVIFGMMSCTQDVQLGDNNNYFETNLRAPVLKDPTYTLSANGNYNLFTYAESDTYYNSNDQTSLKVGFIYSSTNDNPTLEDEDVTITTGTILDDYTFSLLTFADSMEVVVGQKFYYRAYLEDDYDLIYGDVSEINIENMVFESEASTRNVFDGPTFKWNNLVYYYTGISQLKLKSYNPITDEDLDVADFPGEARDSFTTFVIGDKGYLVGGKTNNNEYFDIWEYNLLSNSWNLIYDSPNDFLTFWGFSINDQGYVVINGSLYLLNPSTYVLQYKENLPANMYYMSTTPVIFSAEERIYFWYDEVRSIDNFGNAISPRAFQSLGNYNPIENEFSYHAIGYVVNSDIYQFVTMFEHNGHMHTVTNNIPDQENYFFRNIKVTKYKLENNQITEVVNTYTQENINQEELPISQAHIIGDKVYFNDHYIVLNP